jgi:hypothetical protein
MLKGQSFMETLGPILIGLLAAAVIIAARWVLLRVLLRPSYRRLKLPIFFSLGFLVAAAGAVSLRDELLLQLALGVISLIFLWGAMGVAFQWPGFRDSPTNPLDEHRSVRIVRMDRRAEEYGGWGHGTRPPQPGEMGTIIDIHVSGGNLGSSSTLSRGRA